jgi:DNA-directed RNA polymerase specialized sigma24 family protein
VTDAEGQQSDPQPRGSFHESAVRLLALSQGTDPAQGDANDFEVIVDGLSRFLAGRFQSLSQAEIADIIGESLLRFLEASREGRIDQGRSPAPYLTRIAHNVAVSRLRRSASVELPQSDPGLADDELARLLDARASSERLGAALARAAEAGDHVLLRVVKTWLGLAEAKGAAPGSREVAERLGLSHTSVNEALGRLREYLPG